MHLKDCCSTCTVGILYRVYGLYCAVWCQDLTVCVGSKELIVCGVKRKLTANKLYVSAYPGSMVALRCECACSATTKQKHEENKNTPSSETLNKDSAV